MASRGALVGGCMLLVLAAAACGGGDSDSPADRDAHPSSTASATAQEPTSVATPQPTETTETTDERPAEAHRALHAAVRTMAKEPVTDFVATLTIQDVTVETTIGTVAATGWTARTTTTAPGEESVVMLVRGNGRDVWMQMEGWPEPMTGCWLEMGLTQAPVGVQALAGEQPAYLSVLGYLETSGYAAGSDDRMTASLPIRYATALLPVQTNQELDLSAVPDAARVEVSIGVGPRISSLVLSGETLLRALQAAGGSASAKAELALPAIAIGLRYPTPPDHVDPVEPPDPELVVTDEAGMQAGC